MRISIVIPVYNRSNLLLRTLDTIWRQTYRPLELILVDNGSTDLTLQICKDYQAKYNSDDFVITVCQELKAGANAARNKGLSLVKSDYVSFYDSDDEMMENRMELIANKIKETNADIIATISTIRRNKGSFIRNKLYSCTVEDQILVGMLSTQDMVVRTTLVKNVGAWDETIFRSQDWELGIRLLLHSQKLVWVKDISLDYINQHEKSITGLSFSNSYDYLIHAIDRATIVIKKSNYVKKISCLALLYYRRLWLAGLLYQEKQFALNQKCLKSAEYEKPASLCLRILFQLLYFYIKCGGRGAWKLVRILVK